MDTATHKHLLDFIIDIESRGHHSFSLPEVRSALGVSDEATKQSLRRLVVKNRICPVRRNFYVTISPEYLSQRVLPPALFVDDLMRYIGRPYYVALLSAAALHGAAHQQPQEFFVVSTKPALRRISVRGVVINFVVRSRIDEALTMKKQTDTGFLTVSGPELTAIDCLFSCDRIGGLNRTAEIVGELAPAMTKERIRKLAKADFPTAALQRLGFLLEKSTEAKGVADALFDAIGGNSLKPVLLSPSGTGRRPFPSDRWNVAENVALEIDT